MVKHFVAPEEKVGFEKNVNDVEIGQLAEELKRVSVDDTVENEYWKSLCEELQQQNTCLKISEKVLSNLLEKTIEKNVELVEEKSCELVKCTKETIRSREKLRNVIEQEDSLILEMEQLKREYDTVMTEYKVVKQELEGLKTKIRNEVNYRVEEKINDILVSLEVHKRFLDESKNYANDLEKDNEDLIGANAELSIKLEEYKLMLQSMKESVSILENDKLELEQQLNKVLIDSRAFKEKIDSEFVVIDPNQDDHSMSEVDVHGGNEVLDQLIAINVGEAPPSSSAPLSVTSSTSVPLLSSTVPLSISASSNVSLGTPTSADHQESILSLTATALYSPSLECPLCGETFLQNQVRDLESHVEGHDIENMLNCPVCNKLFDKSARVEYQIHIETHFQLEALEDYQRDQLSLAERGWDLGFD